VTETLNPVAADQLTPWEERNGIWYKMEQYHRNAYGVNGAKFRACRHMLVNAIMDGYEHVVSAQATASPQSSICATLAEELGIGCTIVVGASKPETAVKHRNIAIAMRAGAALDTGCRVAYNGTLQPYGRALAERLGAWQLPYAISMPEDATREELEAFSDVGGRQVLGFPSEVQTLVIPFGSGNTAAGVLYGLSRYLPEGSKLNRVVLVGVGPDRTDWLRRRMEAVGAQEVYNELQIDVMPLHPWFAEYADQMNETLDGIVMHPVYEGKVVRFLNIANPDWWDARDGTTGFWIVGGPI
jgi:1-aminocyclopropane-1-carboxylate deaminase/D-cysteine desulfhydrase-like pyridoxal-dependent ACC family enzyme